MRFRHLDYDPDTPADELGPAAIDALLERGDFEDWKPLLRAVDRDPWGGTADAVLRICDAHPMYGTSALWRTWIDRRRREEEQAGDTLADIRLRAGLTQTQVAERMGISQSDVSKLERRTDVRVSTLRSYARALGARLELSVRLPGEAPAIPLAFPHAEERYSR